MAISLNTSYASLITQTNLNKTNNALSTSQQRLSTGMRINSAADDAAGLQIATRLDGQARGMAVAMRNTNDSVSMLQTAEGAFNEMTDILQRMKDLATQGANDTYSADDRTAMQAEYDELALEINNIMSNTTYAGEALFSADNSAGKFAGAVTFQIGATSAETMTLDLTAAGGDQLQTLTDALDGISTVYTANDATTAGTEISASANGTIDLVNTALDAVTTLRSKFGATINRLGHTNNNLANMRDNTEAARLNIMSTDYAMESANMTQSSMKMQAGISMLNQSGQMSSLAMSLLG